LRGPVNDNGSKKCDSHVGDWLRRCVKKATIGLKDLIRQHVAVEAT
jgi:hypothetical protein